MRILLILSIFFSQFVFAQKISKQDKKTCAGIKKTIYFLADDKLEGRRTGTAGEKLAYEFIEEQFQKAGLSPLGTNNTYIQDFMVKEGREINKETSLSINGKITTLYEDYFPLVFSGNISALHFQDGQDNSIGYFDLSGPIEENKTNPHFDLKENVYTASKKAEAEGKLLFVIYNSTDAKSALSFDAKEKTERLKIPVIYYTKQTKFTKDILLNVLISEKEKTGHNVIGYIDNKAANTIVLGAHYDHLGYGEDHNSLYTGTTPMIHNGADDNASGTSVLIELSKWLKKSDLKKYNFAFLAFSGEELGLFGSKYFTEHSPFDIKTVNYMLNMDMVGRLNDSSHNITVGGFGTSPIWGELIKKENDFLNIKLDSSGVGPSDHTSFYKKDIPVLFFFTGSHSDYHKPTDDAEKVNIHGVLVIVNYIKSILMATDQKEKLQFTKTRDVVSGKSSFKVSMGIMPDYTFDGLGVRVDGVTEGRAAKKAGIQVGDVIYQLGDHLFTDVETYMQALNKFNKGDATKVKLKRGKEEIEVNIIF